MGQQCSGGTSPYGNYQVPHQPVPTPLQRQPHQTVIITGNGTPTHVPPGTTVISGAGMTPPRPPSPPGGGGPPSPRIGSPPPPPRRATAVHGQPLVRLIDVVGNKKYAMVLPGPFNRVTVGELKSSIARKYNIPFGDLRLQFHGEFLRDTNLLSQYDMYPGCDVVVMVAFGHRNMKYSPVRRPTAAGGGGGVGVGRARGRGGRGRARGRGGDPRGRGGLIRRGPIKIRQPPPWIPVPVTTRRTPQRVYSPPPPITFHGWQGMRGRALPLKVALQGQTYHNDVWVILVKDQFGNFKISKGKRARNKGLDMLEIDLHAEDWDGTPQPLQVSSKRTPAGPTTTDLTYQVINVDKKMMFGQSTIPAMDLEATEDAQVTLDPCSKPVKQSKSVTFQMEEFEQAAEAADAGDFQVEENEDDDEDDEYGGGGYDHQQQWGDGGGGDWGGGADWGTPTTDHSYAGTAQQDYYDDGNNYYDTADYPAAATGTATGTGGGEYAYYQQQQQEQQQQWSNGTGWGAAGGDDNYYYDGYGGEGGDGGGGEHDSWNYYNHNEGYQQQQQGW